MYFDNIQKLTELLAKDTQTTEREWVLLIYMILSYQITLYEALLFDEKESEKNNQDRDMLFTSEISKWVSNYASQFICDDNSFYNDERVEDYIQSTSNQNLIHCYELCIQNIDIFPDVEIGGLDYRSIESTIVHIKKSLDSLLT